MIDWENENGFFADGRPLKILCVNANQGGCSYYRIINPMITLAKHFGGIVNIRFDENPLGIETEGELSGQWKKDWNFEAMLWADVVFTQNISNFGGQYTARVVGKAKEFGKFVHYDTDDLLTNLYEGHRLYEVYQDKGLGDTTKFIYNHADLVTVTQRKFAERIFPFVGKGTTLAVLKNAIDYSLPCWSSAKMMPRNKKLCRIGWAGGIHHEEDVKEFAGVPPLVNQRVGSERVWWDFYGKPPPTDVENDKWQQDVWVNYQKTILRGFKGQKNWTLHSAMPSDQYGVMYANMDVAIAPLQMNEFNDSKSEIKVAEAGRYSVPLVASDVGCYDETIVNWETGVLLPPDAPRSEWVKVLKKIIQNKKLREKMGHNLHQITEKHFNINKVVGYRLDLYDEVMKLTGHKTESDTGITFSP